MIYIYKSEEENTYLVSDVEQAGRTLVATSEDYPANVLDAVYVLQLSGVDSNGIEISKI